VAPCAWGITDFAQQSLGDVVYVSLPALGASITSGEAFGEIESTKSVSDLYAPVSGVVTARNDELEAATGADQYRILTAPAGSSRSS